MQPHRERRQEQARDERERARDEPDEARCNSHPSQHTRQPCIAHAQSRPRTTLDEDDEQLTGGNREVVMKRHIAAGFAILGVMAGVGWKLASRTETSAGLQEISINQHSEHSRPGPHDALAGIRIRLSGSGLGDGIKAKDHKVPQIKVAAE
jgi:hypothetical protein